jgi:uncharacterized membrane protein
MARVVFEPSAPTENEPETHPKNAGLPPSLQRVMSTPHRSRGIGWFVSAVLLGLVSAALLILVSGEAPDVAGFVGLHRVRDHYDALHTAAIVGVAVAGLMLIIGVLKRVRSNQATS